MIHWIRSQVNTHNTQPVTYVKHQPRCTLRGRPRIHYNSLGTGSTPYEPFWVDRVDPVLRWHIILRVWSSRARQTAWSRYFNVTSIIVTIILREPPSLSDWRALRWLTWFRLKMIDWRTWLEIRYNLLTYCQLSTKIISSSMNVTLVAVS